MVSWVLCIVFCCFHKLEPERHQKAYMKQTLPNSKSVLEPCFNMPISIEIHWYLHIIIPMHMDPVKLTKCSPDPKLDFLCVPANYRPSMFAYN